MKKVLVCLFVVSLLFTGAATTAMAANDVTPTDLPHEV
jgi:hypothetical protein